MALPHAEIRGALVEKTTVMVLSAHGYGLNWRTVAPELKALVRVSRTLPRVALLMTAPHLDVPTVMVAV
jgi:hypothetical protein